MPVSLIVAEKPSVARDIAKALGVRGRREGYFEDEGLRVTWCVGHLVELAEPGRYDPAWESWRAETLPMLPERFQLQVREGGEEQFKVVKALMRASDVGELVNACDAGREGELIFAYALQLAGAKAPVKRLWISSMTEAAIRDGFRRLRPGPTLRPLEDAARCRSEADWLVGLNATRAMTLRAREGGGGGALLSLGRVQTPVLALIVGREQEIEAFVPQDFWQVKVTLSFAAGLLPLLWTRRDDGKPTVDRHWIEAEAREILGRVKDAPGRVTRVEHRDKAEPPPLLYDLTTLQREANRRFGLSAQQTLDTLQALYERHKVLTYPRTDSRHIGAALVPTLPGLVESLRFGPYQLVAEEILARWPVPLDKRVVDDEEVSDHHAILPTGVDPREAPLTPTEKRLYDLVARRLLAVLSPPARFALAEVQVHIAGEPFEAKGRVRLEAGWQRIDPPMTTRGDELLPTVVEGEVGQPHTTELHQGQTRPPKPYNEAAILGAMERAGEGLEEAELRRVMKRGGLGTPATRAAILETLLHRGYIHRVERELRPTPQGRALIEALPVEELRSARLTGQWEARLAAMAEGEGGRDEFMQDLRGFTAMLVGRILGASLSAGVLRALAPPDSAEGGGELLGACPLCKGEVRLGGRGWRCGGCAMFIPQTVADREVSQRMAKALLKDRRTAPVKGFRAKTGKTFTAALALDDEGKVRFEFPEPEPLGVCPLCQKPVRDRGKVYSCDTGRECAFVVFKEMSGHSVTEAEAQALLSTGRTGLIADLKDRDGKTYSGVLRFDGQKVRAASMDERELEPPIPCGRCVVGEIRFERNKWRCSHCSVKIPGEVAHRPLRRAEVERLVREGRLPKLHGMKQASGAVFKAGVVLDETGTIQLDYHAAEDPLPPEGPPPAFGERVDCPACVAKGVLEPGYIVLGREAYGCSRWRLGCGMRLPLVIEGLRLPEDEARRLFSRHKETTYLKGFTGAKAAGRACRVSFVADTPPHWTLTPKSR